MLQQQRIECGIAGVQQMSAQRFEAPLGGHLHAMGGLVGSQFGAHGSERRRRMAAHQLGEELQLPLARDRRKDASHMGDFLAHVPGQIQPVHARWRQRRQPGRQIEYRQRLAASLAAAGGCARKWIRIAVHAWHTVWLEGAQRSAPVARNPTMPQTLRAAAAADCDPAAELDRLAQITEDVLRRSRAAGASAAEVQASIETGLHVNVRLGEVETVEHTRDRGFGLTVYFGQRKGSASTADLRPESIAATLEHACAIARHTEPDPAAGLADAAQMATDHPSLDLWHPWDVDAEAAITLAGRCEAAGMRETGIRNSEGAGVASGSTLSVYANSYGFLGREQATQHSLSCSLIAGEGEAMQRDHWWDCARAAEDLMDAAALGRRAAERARARLGARSIATGTCRVLFSAEAARSLLGHLVAAVSGGALYRRASFLLDQQGQRIFPAHVDIIERPRLPRGPASAAFDAEGVATREQPLIEHGVLTRYVLGSYSARKLGLASTGNAGGVRNLVLEPGPSDFAQMLEALGTGLLVTELMGQGVNIVTGDYSRGAAGFRVEHGRIVHPVEEVTIASDLRTMFAGIEAVGSDLDARSGLMTPSVLIGAMTVAGH